MMPRAAARRIANEIRSRFAHPASATFLLGENYVGPGGYDLLRYDLGPSGLDSEFHFPLMWALRGAYGDASATLADVESAITAGEADWAGSGAVMGLIIGNHDVARFATVANGDENGDPWTPAAQPTDPLVYAEQRAALAITFALPGAPVVYYGDEVALAGHDDPDSRRVMPADADLGELQLDTRAWVETLVEDVRACSDAGFVAVRTARSPSTPSISSSRARAPPRPRSSSPSATRTPRRRRPCPESPTGAGSMRSAARRSPSHRDR